MSTVKLIVGLLILGIVVSALKAVESRGYDSGYKQASFEN